MMYHDNMHKKMALIKPHCMKTSQGYEDSNLKVSLITQEI